MEKGGGWQAAGGPPQVSLRAGCRLTSTPGPLLSHTPCAIGLALQQPATLQAVAGAAAQHHLRTILVQRA